ncbi:MAG: hypothetical protein IIC69_03345 [Nanoarchaeota archaeon]|nr:hypothetical protein [Nanoarchaeota archaeon]
MKKKKFTYLENPAHSDLKLTDEQAVRYEKAYRKTFDCALFEMGRALNLLGFEFLKILRSFF